MYVTKNLPVVFLGYSKHWQIFNDVHESYHGKEDGGGNRAVDLYFAELFEDTISVRGFVDYTLLTKKEG